MDGQVFRFGTDHTAEVGRHFGGVEISTTVIV
jgi:hypothetical protein